jgi:hypothetical protein
MRCGGSRERPALDLRDRHLAAQDAAHHREELQFAGLQQVQCGRVGAGQVVILRMHAHLQALLALLRHLLPQLHQELVRVAWRVPARFCDGP